MTVTKTAEARTVALPEIADPSQVAPKDARQLSRLFFDQLTKGERDPELLRRGIRQALLSVAPQAT